MMTPWWIHNYKKYNHYVRLNLGAGEMLYGGNNLKNTTGRPIPSLLDFSDFSSIKDPYEKDQVLKKEAWKIILDNKLIFFKKSMKRLFYFWNPLPNHESYKKPLFNTISILCVIPLILSLFYILIYIDRSVFIKLIPLFAIILFITLVHTVTIASIRYRYPLEPILIILLSGSWFHLKSTILEKR